MMASCQIRKFLYVASTEVKWSNGKAEVCYHVEAVLMGAESVMVCLYP